MRALGGIVGFLALLIVVLPDLGAQDKKDPAKADSKEKDKKDADVKDAAKKDAKKDDDKKDEDKSKKKEPKKEPEEKVLTNPNITARLKRLDANSAREFTVEVPQVDPVKVNQLNIWQMNETLRIMRSDPRIRGQQMILLQLQLARKQNSEIYTMKEMDLRAADDCKIRALSPPVEFDEKGRVKTYTQKELNALRGHSKLPGYPADFDRLNAGQQVTVYFAKTKDQPRTGIPRKKNADDDDAAKPEAVLIVVVQEAPMAR
jgi:hypothetical protein